jgi:DHA2 family multidrug resistance protein
MFATAAFVIFALASFWRAGFTPDADFRALALPQLLQGAGIAMYFAPLMAISLGGLPPERMAFGSGLANFFRTTAGSFGASLVTTLWQRREAVHRTRLVERINPLSSMASDAFERLHHVGFGGDQALAYLNTALTHQTTLIAATDLFWMSGWLFLLLIGSVWLAKKPFGAAPVGGH